MANISDVMYAILKLLPAGNAMERLDGSLLHHCLL